MMVKRSKTEKKRSLRLNPKCPVERYSGDGYGNGIKHYYANVANVANGQ